MNPGGVVTWLDKTQSHRLGETGLSQELLLGLVPLMWCPLSSILQTVVVQVLGDSTIEVIRLGKKL